MKAAPSIPLADLSVIRWHDDMIDTLGHDARSDYVETYWLGVVGPTALWILRRLAAQLEMEPDGFTVDMAELAGEVGIGLKGGKNSPFIRAVGRLCQFELAQMQPRNVLAVRRSVPSLSRRHVLRLPMHLQQRHHMWERSQLPASMTQERQPA